MESFPLFIDVKKKTFYLLYCFICLIISSICITGNILFTGINIFSYTIYLYNSIFVETTVYYL